MSYDSTPSYKLRHATFLLDRLADVSLRTHHGISYSEFLVLLMVLQYGPVVQSAIATSLGVSRASITGRVRALVERGFLHVEQSATDPRANDVTLTPEGDALIRVAYAGLDENLAELADGVNVDALTVELDTIIRNARRALGAVQGDPT